MIEWRNNVVVAQEILKSLQELSTEKAQSASQKSTIRLSLDTQRAAGLVFFKYNDKELRRLAIAARVQDDVFILW